MSNKEIKHRKIDLIKATELINPINWKKHNLTVIRDGYLEDGTRVHIVKEPLDNDPVIIDNAIVVSDY